MPKMELQTEKLASKSKKVVEAAPRPRQPATQKMKFCMYHLQGVCKYSADACSFAHTTEEMHVGRGSRRATQAATGGLETRLELPLAASRSRHLDSTDCNRDGSFEVNVPQKWREAKPWPELTEPAFIKPSVMATGHNQPLGSAVPCSDFAVHQIPPAPGMNIDYGQQVGVPSLMRMPPTSLESLAYTSDTTALGLLVQTLADRAALAESPTNPLSQNDLKALSGSIDRLAMLIEHLKSKGQAAPDRPVGELLHMPGTFQQHDADLQSDLAKENTQTPRASDMLGASGQLKTICTSKFHDQGSNVPAKTQANDRILPPPGLAAHNWPAQAVGA